MAKKESSRGTANINTFFKPTNPDRVAWMKRWCQDKLIHNAYCKKQGEGKCSPPLVEVPGKQLLGISHCVDN